MTHHRAQAAPATSSHGGGRCLACLPTYLLRAALILAAFCSLASSGSSGSTLRVPLQYGTIQEGLDAAAKGDTVLVAPGVYTGPGNKDLDYAGKDIVLVSEAGPEATVIDCERDGRGISFNAGETRDAVLKGFTIRNALYAFAGAGIRIGSSPTIEDCIISSNTSLGQGGAGIECRTNNVAPLIIGCSIIDNSAPQGQGGGIRILSDEPGLMIVNCFIAGNSAVSGGGIYCSQTGPVPTLSGSVIIGNRALVNGGGVACNQSSPQIIGSTISGNLVGNDGGGLWCFDNSSPNLERTILRGNCAAELGDEAYFYPFHNAAPTFFTCCALDPFGMEPIELAELIGEQVYADPEFCLPIPCEMAPTNEGDYQLSANSPCLQMNSPCNLQVGALGEGCLIPASTPDSASQDGIGVGLLGPPSPNPFGSTVTSTVTLLKPAATTLRIYAVTGRLVATLVDGQLLAGVHKISWNVDQRDAITEGVYYLTLDTMGKRTTRKIVLAR